MVEWFIRVICGVGGFLAGAGVISLWYERNSVFVLRRDPVPRISGLSLFEVPKRNSPPPSPPDPRS